MLIAACITYSPQMLREVTSLQNSSTIIFWAFQSQSGKLKQLPLTEALFQRCLHLWCCKYVQLEAQIFTWDLNWAWTCPPTLTTHICCSIFLLVFFFFFLRKQEPQKLDPVIFLWLQRRTHRCTLRGSHSVPLSIRFLRIQVLWIILGSEPISLWNNEYPSAYRSICRNPFWTECKGSVFIAPVF